MAVEGSAGRNRGNRDSTVSTFDTGRFRIRRSALVTILAVTLVLAGCQGYEPTVTPSPTPELPTPDTPDPRPSYEQGMADYEPLPTPQNTSADTEANTTEIQLTIIALVNEERVDRGKPELTQDPRLTNLALNKSWMMGDEEFLHHGTGLRNTEQFDKANYNCGFGGENIARTPLSGDEVNRDYEKGLVHVNETALAEVIFQQWMDSEPHREKMLNEHLTTVGVGVYFTIDEDEERWTKGYLAWSTMHLCS